MRYVPDAEHCASSSTTFISLATNPLKPSKAEENLKRDCLFVTKQNHARVCASSEAQENVREGHTETESLSLHLFVPSTCTTTKLEEADKIHSIAEKRKRPEL